MSAIIKSALVAIALAASISSASAMPDQKSDFATKFFADLAANGG